MENSINQRIKLIADKLCDGNISELARISGINQPALRDIVGKKQAKPRFEILNRIVDNSTLNVCGDWILTGKGSMQRRIYSVDSEVLIASEPQIEYGNMYKEKFIDLSEKMNEILLENRDLRIEIGELKSKKSTNADMTSDAKTATQQTGTQG